jgi:nucleoside-diphosphate-sugar epimerase
VRRGPWLLLGGAGYVGHHLSGELSRRGERVVSKDVEDGDFRREIAPRWIDDAGAVLLLAGRIRAPSDEELRDDNLAIVRALVRAIGEARRRPPLLFPSSLWVYDRSDDPVTTASPVDHPRGFYGHVKLECERLLAEAARDVGFPLWIGRASNLVADARPLNPASFVAAMARDLRESGTVTVRSGPVRDVVDVADFAAGLVRRRKEIGRGEAPGLENVCTGVPVELEEVARLAVERARASGRDARLVRHPGEGPDILVGRPEADRAWGKGLSPPRLAELIAGSGEER